MGLRYIAFLVVTLCGVINSVAVGQINYTIKEDKVIDYGVHISPFNFSTRGVSVGLGASKPIAPKTLAYITMGAMTASHLERTLVKAYGVQLKPAVIYFPDITDNFKGMVVGVELPVYLIGINRNEWQRKTTTGDLETFEYLEFHRIQARSFQAGLGGIVGLRTHRRNHTFFWQPTVSFGFIFKKLSGYTESNLEDDVFRNINWNRVWLGQNSGIAPYINLEIIYGLYKYRKTNVRVMEL